MGGKPKLNKPAGLTSLFTYFPLQSSLSHKAFLNHLTALCLAEVVQPFLHLKKKNVENWMLSGLWVHPLSSVLASHWSTHKRAHTLQLCADGVADRRVWETGSRVYSEQQSPFFIKWKKSSRGYATAPACMSSSLYTVHLQAGLPPGQHWKQLLDNGSSWCSQCLDKARFSWTPSCLTPFL